MINRHVVLPLVFAITGLLVSVPTAAAQTFDYNKQVAPIFRKYCNGCHNAKDAEGELVLDRFSKLIKGGENGKILVPGQPEKSRLILLLEKKAEPFMPPEDNKAPTAAEIAILKAWIKAGARGPVSESGTVSLVTPKITPTGKVRQPITAMAYAPDGKWIAVARYGKVEILSAGNRKLQKTLGGHAGHVNQVGFSQDGTLLFAAGGEPGLQGECSLWNTSNWKRVRKIVGHADSIYAAEMSPDGKLLATGSYDRSIRIWDVDTGNELRRMNGHNGPVFDVAFHPQGKILASASGDRTVKLWNVASGERLDTFNEPTKGQNTVAFSPDGRYVVAGGIDNRIRVWEILKNGKEGTNPNRYSRFAHDAPILNLRFSKNGRVLVSSAEDYTIKLWETREFTQLQALKNQSDWSPALALNPNSQSVLVGRLDGTTSVYPLNIQSGEIANVAAPITGTPVPMPHKNASPSAKLTKISEKEPNDLPKQATWLSTPGTATGVFNPAKNKSQDVDLYRFESKQGQSWMIETMAAREKSPADTKVEVLYADGRPVVRLLLHAVRDSYITFRPIDSRQTQARVKNWKEMELNEYLYLAGEVCKLFRLPEGPDSGLLFYESGGKRRCYFDTTATIHAKDDPVYIVTPYLPGTKLVDNGLPVFPLTFSNDDDGEREAGNDSRLLFTAPTDGSYLVRVTDVRGFSGEKYKYQLTVREPKPDFSVTLDKKNATIPAGSGQRFTLKLNRIDNFDGDVRVNISGMPAGFHVSSPVVIEAGHLAAKGVINVNADVPPSPKKPADKPDKTKPVEAPKPQPFIDWSHVKITATATIHGKQVVKNIGDFGKIRVAPQPKLIVHLELDQPPQRASSKWALPELTIAAGATITARLRIERNGTDGALRFDIDNLPHGVIVGNLGLSGITLLKGQNERRLYLTARDWVPESTRLIHAVCRSEGSQASRSMLLHVRRPRELANTNP